MDAVALLRDVAAGRLPRLLLVHGPDGLLVEEVVDRLAARLLADPEASSWNREVCYADSAAPEAIVEAGLALPLFGGRRLVLVRGVVEASAKVLERLRASLDAARARPGGWPTEGTTVLLVASGIERRSAALKLLPEADQVEVRPPTGRAVVGWLRERARAAGLELAPAAAEALIELVGEEPARLAGELDKAGLAAGAEGRITEEAVRALVGESRLRQYWELRQALEDARRESALRILEQLLASGEEPTVLLGQIADHARDLWRVKGGLVEGRDARRIGELLPRRRPSFAVERLMARARAVSGAALVAALGRCFEVERKLKTSGGDPRALLTLLVTDLTAA